MKKKFILLIIIIVAKLACIASNSAVKLSLDALPIYFDKDTSWRYSENDSNAFRLPDYNDKLWMFKLTTLYYQEDKNNYFNGIAWFRLKCVVDSNLVGIPLALSINHYGASEIYIDGELIKKYGEIKGPNKTSYYDPKAIPLTFAFVKAGVHLIAIRYANYHAKRNFEEYDDPMAGFNIKIGEANNVIESKSVNLIALSSIFMVLAGFFLSFCLIHFFMFLLNRDIRSNLYFSVFMLSLGLGFVIALIIASAHNTEYQLKSAYLLRFISISTFVTLSGFINELFSKSKTRFYIILLVGFLIIILQYFQYEYYGDLLSILVIFILLEAIFIVTKSIVKKVKGAWIIGTGILFFTIFILVTLLISLLNDGEMSIENNSLTGQIIVVCIVLTIVSIPLSMSIYLAWNFSTINKNLSLQLEQVKVLSQKNIEQEQEKQKILENKKEELEAQVLERTAELRIEKKKSDDLLLNILPAEIAEELKEKGSAVARDYDKVTVMFTDFKDFTKISELLTPSELVKEIDFCFSAFDRIIQKHNIEKIKTIGDAYMCVGGLPIPTETHAQDVINAALEMRDFMQNHNQEKALKGEPQFRIRIGIHTGSVVAGIVGVKKFAYDIWGDTVNIASRMESSGEPNKVNISGTTFELVNDKFNCQHRGKVQAKNKGEIDMYFVEH
jgi:class 3 adenylate cyclase